MKFESREQLEQWLAKRAPADSADVPRVAYLALHELEPNKRHDLFAAFRLLERKWCKRASISEDDLWGALEAAKQELKEKAAQAERERIVRLKTTEAKRAAERQRKRAAEERARKHAEEHTTRVKRLAKALRLSTRQSQRLLREGTKDAKRAEQIAQVLGGDATRYLEPRAKPGRQPDLLAHMMRARGAGLAFRDFAEDDVSLTGSAKTAVWGMAEELADFRDFEGFLSAARKRGIDPDVAHHVWLEYMLWRIQTVADRAEEIVRDKIAALFDFG